MQFDHEIPPPTHEGPADEAAGARGGARDHRVRDRARRGGRRRHSGRVRARTPACARLRDADRSLRRSRCASLRHRHGAHARGARGVSRVRHRAPRPRRAGLEPGRALALRAVGVEGRGRDHDRLDRRPGGEAREPGGGVVRLDPHPVRRPERRRAGRAAVRPAPARSARAARSSLRRAAAGSPSTTTSATEVPRCCGDLHASFATGWAP